MTEQVRPALWLVEDRFTDLWKSIAAPGSQRLDASDVEGVAATDTPPPEEVDRDAASSIFFTSGSSGRPKAILGRLKGIDHAKLRWLSGSPVASRKV